MTKEHQFPKLEATARRLAGRGRLQPDELRALLCHDCDFWHEGHEEDLECSCYGILAMLLARGALTPESLAEALASPGDDESQPA